MADMLRRTLADPESQAIAWAAALVYVLLFQIAVADLTIDGTVRPASIFVVESWQDLVLRTRAPFQFEAYAFILAWIVSRWEFGLVPAIVAGTVFGLVIYFVNFYGFTAVFPWFADGRGWIGIFAHAMYGLVLGAVYHPLSVRA